MACSEHMFYGTSMAMNLTSPEMVENHRRSVAMLQRGQVALDREQALEVLEELRDARDEVRRLRAFAGDNTKPAEARHTGSRAAGG